MTRQMCGQHKTVESTALAYNHANLLNENVVAFYFKASVLLVFTDVIRQYILFFIFFFYPYSSCASMDVLIRFQLYEWTLSMQD